MRPEPATVPSPARLRAVVLERWTRPTQGGLSLADQFSDAFGLISAVSDELWDIDDFRPSEIDRFDQLRSAAIQRVQQQAEHDLIEAVLGALVAFAQEHPRAPRSDASS